MKHSIFFTLLMTALSFVGVSIQLSAMMKKIGGKTRHKLRSFIFAFVGVNPKCSSADYQNIAKTTIIRLLLIIGPSAKAIVKIKMGYFQQALIDLKISRALSFMNHPVRLNRVFTNN